MHMANEITAAEKLSTVSEFCKENSEHLACELLSFGQSVENIAYSLVGDVDASKVADLIIIAAQIERAANKIDSRVARQY